MASRWNDVMHRRWFWEAVVACALSSGCAAPAAPSPPHVVISRVPTVAPAASESVTPVEPQPSPLPEPAKPVFVIRKASKVYDFTLTFDEACPEAEKGEACRGPATLLVARKDGSGSKTIDVKEAWVRAGADGEPLVNATELYDEQGTINVGDFNFDGREDFALLSGESGPYGGPTFSIFLATGGAGSSVDFKRSDALSEVTEETLGMFQVDAKHKRLATLAKSGCCFHVSEELAVVNDKPVVMSRVTEDATGDKLVITRETRSGSGMKTTVERRPMPKN